MCRVCRQSCRGVKFDFQCGLLYHDYCKLPGFVKPDLGKITIFCPFKHFLIILFQFVSSILVFIVQLVSMNWTHGQKPYVHQLAMIVQLSLHHIQKLNLLWILQDLRRNAIKH